MPLRPFSFGGTPLSPGAAVFVSSCPRSNNNLSKKLFVNIGDTSNANHSKIDQIADFYGATWVKNDYNSTFGGRWCFIDSTVVNPYGPYAVQRIMSCENAAILATRYCTKGTWGAWNVGVTKSDLVGRTIYVAGNGRTQNFNIVNNGFLFIPYTSTTCGIYYLGMNSAKLILGTEDSDFKVSIS